MRNISNKYQIILLFSTIIVIVGFILLALSPKLSPQITYAKSVPFSIIETELIPLKLTSDQVSMRIDMALGGGAIELIGDKLIIMDRLGKIFVYKDGGIIGSEVPDLPIYMEDFVDSESFPVTEGSLRAHDLEYDKEEGFLYASYDSGMCQ